MSNKNIIKIINEVISEFDFLGNDKNNKEQEIIDLLKNEELQKQFICDSLLNKKDRIKILNISDSTIGGNWDEVNTDNATTITIKYDLKIQYTYDINKEPLIFNLYFDSDGITIDVTSWHDSGDYNRPPEGESWIDKFNWDDIEVTLFTIEGDDIPFIAFQKAPPRIQTLFIRNYIENFIGNETGMDIRTGEMNDKVQNIPYC